MTYQDNRNNTFRQEVLKTYGHKTNDSGSPEVQIALFTHRIKDLTAHMAANKKDFTTKRSLVTMVSKRKRLLEYLNRKDRKSYNDILEKLNLRK